mmetsp:Transcript_92357/g.266623  ORF Transcript_92357/g.266623 Transcript_92357/m.266623 type:complete len:493 (+) Transcript_92357:152-1630(+)
MATSMAASADAIVRASGFLDCGGLSLEVCAQQQKQQQPDDTIVGQLTWGIIMDVSLFFMAFAIIRCSMSLGSGMLRKPGGGKGRKVATQRAVTSVRRAVSEQFEHVAQALLKSKEDDFVQEVIRHLSRGGMSIESAYIAMDVLAVAGKTGLLSDMRVAVAAQLDWRIDDERFDQLMLVAQAAAGDDDKVRERLANGEASLDLHRAAVRGYAASKAQTHKAVDCLARMNMAGQPVVPKIVVELIRQTRRNAGDVRELVTRLGETLDFSAEVAQRMFQGCLDGRSMDAVARVEEIAMERGIVLPAQAYKKWLIACADGCDKRGAAVVRRMMLAGHTPCDELCKNLMTRCATTRDFLLAEALAACLRSSLKMDLAAYSALLAVYESADMHGNACDLYSSMMAAGLRPGRRMLQCLLRCAEKAGRTSLKDMLLDRLQAERLRTPSWYSRRQGEEPAGLGGQGCDAAVDDINKFGDVSDARLTSWDIPADGRKPDAK